MPGTGSRPREVRVLMSSRFDDPATWGNPYVILFTRSLPAPIVPVPFSWRRALLSRYAVFHVQWPEILVRGRGTLRTLARLVFFTALLVRLSLLRTPVVRTMHNEQPHETGRGVESALLAWLDRITSARLVLNRGTRTPDGAVTVYVPHGHYRSWYRPAAGVQPTQGSLLFFGQIRGYKGVGALVDAVPALPPRYSLRVLGNPSDDGLREELVAKAEGINRVTLDLGFTPEDQLVEAICHAQFVVLPYTNLHNSGALLMALSLNRPVVVPSTPSTRELAEEFGTRWLLLYDAPLTAEKLAAVLARAEADPPTAPLDMSTRDWEPIGARVAEVYLDCLASRRRGTVRQPVGERSDR